MGKHGELLGAHIVGTHATELIHEYVLFRTMEGIDEGDLCDCSSSSDPWRVFSRSGNGRK